MIPTIDTAPEGIATRHDRYPDAQIRTVLREARSIALVGASANPARPSYIVFKYLSERGYAVTPVNPGLAPATASRRQAGSPGGRWPGRGRST